MNVHMEQIALISFDAEGTIVTPEFSSSIWHEAIPALYAQKRGLDFAQAKRTVFAEYDEIGEHRLEWYDVEYWFRRLDLGSPEQVIQKCLSKIEYYPEATRVLSSLASEYRLIVASCTPVELLHFLLQDIEPFFVRVFSSVSHYGQLKSPGFYLRICQEMGVAPHQVIHVGDNWQFDVVNSREAGLQSFHLDRSAPDDQESLGDLTQLERLVLSAR